MAKCYYCGKTITGKSNPIYPGKVPGANKVVEVTETPYDKTMEVTKLTPMLVDGKPVLDIEGYPTMEAKTEEVVFTSGVKRDTTIHWEAGDTPIPQAHLTCPKQES